MVPSSSSRIRVVRRQSARSRIGQIFVGEEDLGCHHAETRKGLGVQAHEVALPHGRAGLAEANERGRCRRPSKLMPMPTAPLDTSTTSRPACRLPRQTFDQIHHTFAGDVPAVPNDDMGAQLDNQTVTLGECGAAGEGSGTHESGLTLPWPWFVW